VLLHNLHLQQDDLQAIIVQYFEKLLKSSAASRKVAGSIPDKVIEIFQNLPNPSSRITALMLTQTLTEMSAQILAVE
jgi:hypothetical protein